MDLFLSTYENKLDAKGRVSVPAPFRSVLERNRSPLYIYKSLTLPCLEGCGPDRIGQIVDAIDEMDSLSKEAEVLQTMLFSAQEMKIDSDGRMLLPAEFIAFAGLDGMAHLPALADPSRSGGLTDIKTAREIPASKQVSKECHA